MYRYRTCIVVGSTPFVSIVENAPLYGHYYPAGVLIPWYCRLKGIRAQWKGS